MRGRPHVLFQVLNAIMAKCWLLAGLLALALVSTAPAATYTYPGAAPCDGTLQDCIDATSPGDTVEIATNTPIDESLTLPHSLTLRAAAGYNPSLAEGNNISASVSGAADATFTIQGITLQRGTILTINSGTGTMTANILGNTIVETGGAWAFRVWNNSTGTIILNLSGNQAFVPAPFVGSNYGIHVAGAQGTVQGTIANNTLEMEGPNDGGAIHVSNSTDTVTVDIMGNYISGTDFNNGILVYQFSEGGTINARIINNVVTGQAGNVGLPAALGVNCSHGTVNFSMVNNTVADNEDGIGISGREDLGATISGNIDNNIVANSSQGGLSIGWDEAAVTNSHNLVYNNNYDYFTPGPGTVFSDPRFVGASDYRLQPSSPAVNAGNNSSVPPDITTDILGASRIYGGTVDIGAYELQQAQVFIPLLGPWGMAAFALLILLAALVVMKRDGHRSRA